MDSHICHLAGWSCVCVGGGEAGGGLMVGGWGVRVWVTINISSINDYYILSQKRVQGVIFISFIKILFVLPVNEISFGRTTQWPTRGLKIAISPFHLGWFHMILWPWDTTRLILRPSSAYFTSLVPPHYTLSSPSAFWSGLNETFNSSMCSH